MGDDSCETCCSTPQSLKALDDITYRPHSAECQVDRPLANLWRSGYLSDWELRLGDLRFTTHRAILATRSEVLAASMNESYGQTGTDLTNLLPPLTHSVFEYVLDEIYEEHSSADETVSIMMFTVADILGIRKLFDKVFRVIKLSIEECAAQFLQDIRQLPFSVHLEKIAAAAQACVARDFARWCPPSVGVSQFHPLDVKAILASDELAAREDDVFDVIWDYVEGHNHPMLEGSASSASPPGPKARGAGASDGSEAVELIKTRAGSAEAFGQNARATSSDAREPAPKLAVAERAWADGAEASLWRNVRLGFISADRVLRLRRHLESTGCVESMQIFLDAMILRTSRERDVADCDLRKEFESRYARRWLGPRRPPHIAAPNSNELDFVVSLPRHPKEVYKRGHCLRSEPKDMEGGVSISILVFPNGTACTKGTSDLVPIFVEVCPSKGRRSCSGARGSRSEEAGGSVDWSFKRSYFISIWPWTPGLSPGMIALRKGVDALRAEKNPDVNSAEVHEESGAVRWCDKHTFRHDFPDRGWYEFPHDRLRCVCDQNGFLWIRARVWSAQNGGRW